MKVQIIDYLINKFDLNSNQRHLPIQIPNVGRDDIVDWIREFDFRVGVEVGVERGLFTETICKFNPQMKLYAIDPWEAYEGYRDYDGQEELVNRHYEYTKRRLKPFKNCEIIREFSMEAVKRFKDESLDFVYIDGNHEIPYITDDLYYWSRKVRTGGIVSGHDYGRPKRFRSKNHVYYAVNMYTQAFRIRPWFMLGERHSEKGNIRDKSLSWMWVKVHDYC